LSSVAASATDTSDTTAVPASYIVQADSVVIAKQAVIAVDGEITHEFGIINAVGALLSAEQYGRLAKDGRLKIQRDRSAGVAAARLLRSVNLSRIAKVGDGPSTFMSTATTTSWGWTAICGPMAISGRIQPRTRQASTSGYSRNSRMFDLWNGGGPAPPIKTPPSGCRH